jgi:hypothetical protein
MVGSGLVISTSTITSFRSGVLQALLLCFAGCSAFAQDGGEITGRQRMSESQNLTGYWVSVVTQHWHYRMRMPPKGATAKIPLNETGRRILESWNPEADAANGHACRAYGAGNIMRIPGRFHIHWADDNTLQIDTDSGTQTRLLQFAPQTSASEVEPSLQGRSAAAWVGREGAPEGSRNADQNDPNAVRYLVASTSRLLPGYLLKNGVPYSGSTTLEEHFYTFTEPNGDEWLVVTTLIDDPEFLARQHVTTNQYKREPDDSGWDPTPCQVDKPR